MGSISFTQNKVGTINFGKVKKRKKSDIPQEVVDSILSLNPEDLAVEAARESLAIQELKDLCANDDKITTLKERIKEFEAELQRTEAVIKAKEDLAVAIENNTTEDHMNAKEDLKALRGGYTSDIRERNKKYKFMMKTLRSHMKAGLLKSRVD